MDLPILKSFPEISDMPLAKSLIVFSMTRPDDQDFLLGQWLQILATSDLHKLSGAFRCSADIAKASNAFQCPSDIAKPNDIIFFKEATLIGLFSYLLEKDLDEASTDLDYELITGILKKLSMAATIQCLNRAGAVYLPSLPLSVDPDTEDDIAFEPYTLSQRQYEFEAIPGFDAFVAPAIKAAVTPYPSATYH
ncbi:hypothetical protein LWH94_09775 [Marinobacter sp. G11]|uniref:hypothetical protein n=1 Tax=Marinobacter sp. G11 TaxID=2903522 RepID=UPI001E326BA4|nr:hypothetical protein [Marinobacter sp. G11]MCE0759491.1 hypothetical protein [Marinobacter sp. G11]